MDPTEMAPPTRRRQHMISAATATLLAGAAVALLPPAAAHAISGGTAVASGEMSYVAEVRNIKGGLCTGTLIDPNWVLTASHCATPQAVSDVYVRVGNTQAANGGERRAVVDIRRNPGYTGGHNDVALLRLSTPITTITPVKLATPDNAARWDGLAPADSGTAVGWGQTVAGGGGSGTLLKTTVSIRPTQIDAAGIPMIMVGPGPCQGDSGGPLLVRDAANQLVQAGVTKAANCGNNGDYSEVGAGPNRDWILSRIGFTTPFGTADWDRDGHPDVIARANDTGDLWMYPGVGGRTWPDSPVRIGNGWSNATPFGVADWDGDGKPDIISRNDDTGDLVMFPGRGVRGYPEAPWRIGNGWGMATSFGMADWDGDGRQDIIEREDANGGDLKAFYGRGGRQYPGSVTTIGTGWRNYTSFGTADWNSDGRQDVIARYGANADLRLFPGKGDRGSPNPYVRIGNGWFNCTSFGDPDWDGDGKADILARFEDTHTLMLAPGRGVAGYPDPWVWLYPGM